MDLELLEGNTIYKLQVNEADYSRAQNDLTFAQTLLNHAKMMDTINKRKTSEQNTINKRKSSEHLDMQNAEDFVNNLNEDDELPTQDSEEQTTQVIADNSRWTYNETLALIVTMENYLNDINHPNPKKKQNAWAAINGDLESENVFKTADACRLKWKNLLRSYAICKDNNSKTGRRPSRFMYFDEIDKLIGQKPNYSSPHSINVLSPQSSSGSSSKESSPALEDAPSTSKELAEPQIPKVGNKRKQQVQGVTTLKRKLLEKKIDEMEMQQTRKNERYQQKMQLLERKILVDERKCQLFERYLNLKEQEQKET